MMHKTAKVKIMKKIYYVPALLAGILSVASCNDKEPDGGKTPADLSKSINFNIGQESPNSRTHYATNDWLQIEWDKGDLITIACDQTLDNNKRPYKSAEYIVTQPLDCKHKATVVDDQGTESEIEITTKSAANIGTKSGVETDGLFWKGDGVEHTFYAGYGEGITIDPSTGVATCKYDTDQVLTLDTKTNTWINMKQAYMVAKATATPKATPVENQASRSDDETTQDESGSVFLNFHPIMTTIEVDVQGPDAGSITVQALEVIIPETQDVIYGDGKNIYFDCNITDKGGSAVQLPKADRTAEKIIFRLSEPQTINHGEVIKITALLPPVEISTSNTATFSVYAYQGSSTAMFIPQKIINPSAKAVIKTTPWKKKSIPQDPVDLGLDVKWGKFNLGATQAHEYGDYYGWGCILPYASSEYVNWPHYFHRLGTNNYQGDACGTDKDPLKDYVINQKSIAGSEWDAAKYRLGGKWRMPTLSEIEQLFDPTQCNRDWTVESGVKCIKFTIKNDATKSIFLPATGGLIGSDIFSPSLNGYYWSSTPVSGVYQDGYSLELIVVNGNFDTGYKASRYWGFTIRPVWDESIIAPSTDITPQGSSETPETIEDWE
mgnify:CR=1 FL=1